MTKYFCRALILLVILGTQGACTHHPPPPPGENSEAPAHPPYRNEDGWTVFTPAKDTRIIYVSEADGNDQSAKVYNPSDMAIGPTPRTPRGPIKPFKSFKAAFSHTRDGYPDWILLKRGDTFHGAVAVRNGRSGREPFLLASYGSDPDMPLVKTGAQRALEICCQSFNDIAVQGLDFYAHTRNFDSPEFSSSQGGSGIFAYAEQGHRGTGLLIEGCKFRFFTGNYIQTDGKLSNITFRRNLVLDSYSTESHSQGLYARNASMTVEENIFDHNGWYRQQQSKRLDNRAEGQATMFNHNTYFQDSDTVTFRNNIFMRPASIGNKWTANGGQASTRNVTISNNLYIDGEIGISMGGNKKGPLRFKNVSIYNNVLLNVGRSQPTGRDFAWYIDVLDWDGGEIRGNTFVHPGSSSTNNIFAIRLTGTSHHVDISDNRIYGFGNGQAITVAEKVKLEGIRIFDNSFYLQAAGSYFVRAKDSIEGLEFFGNHYLSESRSNHLFSVGGKRLSLASWSTHSGDKTSRFHTIDTMNHEDLIEGYQRSLGEKPSFEAFIDKLRSQSYTNWNEDYTAESVNHWIRRNLPKETFPNLSRDNRHP